MRLKAIFQFNYCFRVNFSWVFLLYNTKKAHLRGLEIFFHRVNQKFKNLVMVSLIYEYNGFLCDNITVCYNNQSEKCSKLFILFSLNVHFLYWNLNNGVKQTNFYFHNLKQVINWLSTIFSFIKWISGSLGSFKLFILNIINFTWKNTW